MKTKTNLFGSSRNEKLISKLESQKKINWFLRKINVFGRVFFQINKATFGESMVRPVFSNRKIT